MTNGSVRGALTLAAGLATGILVGEVPAAGVHDLADGWLVSIPGYANLLADGRPAFRNWSGGFGVGRLFGLRELPQWAAHLEWAGGFTIGEVVWEGLGGDLLRTDNIGLELLAGSRWRLGARLTWERLALTGDRTQHASTCELRGRFGTPTGWLVDLWWPLTPAPLWHGDAGLQRWLRVEAGNPGWRAAGVLERSRDGRPSVQSEFLVAWGAVAALGVRVDPASGSLGPVTAWRFGDLLIRTSHLVHPELGVTHRWALDWSRGVGGEQP